MLKRLILFWVFLLFCVGGAHAEYMGSWKIDDTPTITLTTGSTTNVATDADSAPAYRVYEDTTDTAILTGTMSKLDDTNTTGLYRVQLTLSAANGFEKGKTYTIVKTYAVSSNNREERDTFQIEAAVSANSISAAAASQIALEVVRRERGYLHVLPVGASETYTTIGAAASAAVSGDLIVVFPGSYTPTAEIGKDGVDYYFCDKASVTSISAGDALFHSDGEDPDVPVGNGYGNVYGHGFFTLTSANQHIFHDVGSNSASIGTYFEADTINSSGTTCVPFDAESVALVVNVRKANAGTGVLFNAAADITFTADRASGSGTGGLINNSGGTSYVNIKYAKWSGAGPLLVHSNGTPTTILNGTYEGTSSSGSGIGSTTGTIILLDGAVKVVTGRASLFGSAPIYATESFAYLTSSSTATNVMLTRGRSIDSRLPPALASGALMASDAQAVASNSADATAWKTFIESLAQLRYRVGLDDSGTTTPPARKPHLEINYVHP